MWKAINIVPKSHLRRRANQPQVRAHHLPFLQRLRCAQAPHWREGQLIQRLRRRWGLRLLAAASAARRGRWVLLFAAWQLEVYLDGNGKAPRRAPAAHCALWSEAIASRTQAHELGSQQEGWRQQNGLGAEHDAHSAHSALAQVQEERCAIWTMSRHVATGAPAQLARAVRHAFHRRGVEP